MKIGNIFYVLAITFAACKTTDQTHHQLKEMRSSCQAVYSIAKASGIDSQCPALLTQSPLGQAICNSPFIGPQGGEPIFPNQSEQNTFTQLTHKALTNDIENLSSDFAALKFTAVKVQDEGETYTVIYDLECHRGSGTYIIRHQSSWPLVVEVPHLGFESETLAQGFALLKAGAKALFLAGSHRCASKVKSACRGSQKGVCDGEPQGYRQSDVAAFDQTFFQAAHRAVTLTQPTYISLSLHGKRRLPSEPAIIISDGTKLPSGENSLSLRLTKIFKLKGLDASSCQEPNSKLRLCGASSLQGRLSNGVADACAEDANTTTGSFIHLEQEFDRIESEFTPSLISALNEIFLNSNSP